jgi:hypothetical protein
MPRVIDRIDAWWFGPGSARQLAAIRIGLMTLLTLRLSWRAGVYLGLSDQPASLFHPESLMRLFDHMPSHGVIELLLWIAIPAAALGALGLGGRFAIPIAWGAAFVLNTMMTSQGKIVHNDVLLTLCLVPLLPARHSDVWSLDALIRRRRGAPAEVADDPAYGWPVKSMMLIVSAAYFFVGLHKVIDSGIPWFRSGNLRWVLYTAIDSSPGVPLGDKVGRFIADHPHFTQLFAFGTLVLECGFPLVLLFPILRWFFVPGVISLHLGIALMMHLNYVAQWATVGIVFINWAWLSAYLSERTRGRAPPQPAPTSA